MRATLPLLGLLLACDRRLTIDAPMPARDPSAAWAELLSRAARPNGVDYALIEQEHDTLRSYLKWAGEHGPNADAVRESNEDKRISLLVNAYNAWVVEGVLRNMPISSVQDVSFGLYSRKPGMSFFVGQQVRVDKDWTNLYRLEVHSILARYQEPMLHVTLNCASKGCPPLRYWPDRGLQATMERSWRIFLSSSRALQPRGDGWAASELFFWYEDDFLDWSDAISLCDWLGRYATDERGLWLRAHAEDCPLQRFDYDWSLNALSATEAAAPPTPVEEAVPVEAPAAPADEEDESF